MEFGVFHEFPRRKGQTEAESFAELQKGPGGNIGAAMIGFIMSAVWGEGYGGNFTGHLDNELLGLKGMSDEEIKALVRSLL